MLRCSRGSGWLTGAGQRLGSNHRSNMQQCVLLLEWSGGISSVGLHVQDETH